MIRLLVSPSGWGAAQRLSDGEILAPGTFHLPNPPVQPPPLVLIISEEAGVSGGETRQPHMQTAESCPACTPF